MFFQFQYWNWKAYEGFVEVHYEGSKYVSILELKEFQFQYGAVKKGTGIKNTCVSSFNSQYCELKRLEISLHHH